MIFLFIFNVHMCREVGDGHQSNSIFRNPELKMHEDATTASQFSGFASNFGVEFCFFVVLYVSFNILGCRPDFDFLSASKGL